MLFHDLDFDDVGRVLNDLGDVGSVLSTDFTPGTFCEVAQSTGHPKLPENSNRGTEGSTVGLDHAERSVERPEEEEHHEQVVSVPETLEVGTTRSLQCGSSHCHQASQHDVSGPTRAGGEVSL